jgi:hypothetical protein
MPIARFVPPAPYSFWASGTSDLLLHISLNLSPLPFLLLLTAVTRSLPSNATLIAAIAMDLDVAVEPELDSLSLTLPLPYRVALIIVLGGHSQTHPNLCTSVTNSY